LCKAQCGHFDVIETCSDTQEQVGDHRGDDLQANGVVIGAEEFADIEMLLNPAEQELDLPACLVEVGVWTAERSRSLVMRVMV
jgi:hypothetical protein